jgi:hypothetical protein
MVAGEKATVAQAGDALTLELPRRLGAGWRPGTEVDVTPFGFDAALLVRGDLAASGFLAATLSAFSVADAFGYVLSGIRTGKLVVTRGAVRRSVSFREGQVVFAHSSEPWQRLGTALVRLGRLTGEQLAEALAQVKPGARLGQVLTRNGMLSPARLYSAMTHVVREIVVDLFAETEGELLFMEGLPPAEDVLKLPDATRELAVEGLRRAEDVQRLRDLYPNSLIVAQGSAVPEEGRDVWTRAAAGASVAELREVHHGGEHAFLSLLGGLLRSGALEIHRGAEEATAPGELDARPVLERYRDLVRLLCRALLKSGEGIESLRSFLAEPVPGSENAFQGVTLSEAGELDVERVVGNLGQGAVARARAYEVLDAFVWYALFTARNVVPPEEAERLTADLRRAHEATS